MFIENKKLVFIQRKPYFVFKIENFLDIETYDYLYDNFPTLNVDKLNFDSLKKNDLKYHFNSRSEEYSERIKNNLTMNKIENIFFSESFLKSIMRKFYLNFFISRKNDFKYLIKLLRIFRFNKRLERDFKDKFIFTDILADVEYSFMLNKAKISAHTDSRQKLISLMLYFPDKLIEPEKLKELGTTFYTSKQTNFWNRDLNDEEETEFKKKSISKYSLPFEKFHLYGFIRNDKSWHTVEEFDIHPNFIRKSININLYI